MLPSRGSAWPRDQICISCIGRQILHQHMTCFITYLSLFPMRGRPRLGTSSSTALSAISLCSLRVGFFSFLQETRWTYWTQIRPGSCKTWFQIYQPFPLTASNSYHLLRTCDVPCTHLDACFLVIIIHDPYCNPGKYIYLSSHPQELFNFLPGSILTVFALIFMGQKKSLLQAGPSFLCSQPLWLPSSLD